MSKLRLVLAGGLLLATPSLAHAQLTFVDQTDALGVQSTTFGRSVATVDMDGDGQLDIVSSNDSMPLDYFRQLPDHTFVDASLEWSVPQDNNPHRGLLVADFDGDSDPDIYIANGLPATDNQILRNDIDTGGGIVDVTADAGAAGLFAGSSFAATALDYDRDGLLDVFVANFNLTHADLIHNDGGLVFSDVSEEAGITHIGEYRNCGAADFDNDGWIDIGVGNFFGSNRLYRNNHNGTFANVADLLGASAPGKNFGLVFADFDNNGWMDLFIPKWNEFVGPETVILMGDGERYRPGPLMGMQTAMGHNVADLDNDGYPDIYIGTGAPAFASEDVLFRITPDGLGSVLAEDISASAGILALGDTRCHGMGIGDLDDDGDLDIYTNNGGPASIPESIQENALWINAGNSNNWSGLDLAGVFSNRSAVGAKAKAIVPGGREIHRHIGVGHGFANTNSPTLHFGLGVETAIERYDIVWPSGIEQVVLNPPVGERISLTETGLRQVGPVTPGQPVTIEACGPAGLVLKLFLSFTTGSITSPQLGGMLLLGAPVQPFGSIALDPSGLGELTFQVPDNPAYIGVTGYFQALVTDPTDPLWRRTTNRIQLTPQ